jgi:dihydroflavonol-4-reductase
MSEKLTIGITGTSGHLAASVIPLLIKKGYRIKALQYKQELPFVYENLEIIKGSLSDIPSLDRLVSGCDTVIHSAARISIHSDKDAAVYDTNVNGTKHLFNAAKRADVRRFLYISSIHVYNQFPVDEMLDETRPYCEAHSHLYDRSKRDAEQFVLQNATGPMEVVVLNPTAIMGPFDFKPSLIGKGIIDFYNRRVPSLISGGFDFVDVRDVAEGIVNAINDGRNGQSYLLSGKWHSLAELFGMIMHVKGDPGKLPVLPYWAGYLGLPFTNLWASIKKIDPLYTKESLDTLKHGNKKISSIKAARELGYHCRPLQETITDTINWFKTSGYLQ